MKKKKKFVGITMKKCKKSLKSVNVTILAPLSFARKSGYVESAGTLRKRNV